jgi:cell division protein FtsA
VARPENLVGMVDQLHSPAYATSVGLLNWALLMNDAIQPSQSHRHKAKNVDLDSIKNFLYRLLP